MGFFSESSFSMVLDERDGCFYPTVLRLELHFNSPTHSKLGSQGEYVCFNGSGCRTIEVSPNLTMPTPPQSSCHVSIHPSLETLRWRTLGSKRCRCLVRFLPHPSVVFHRKGLTRFPSVPPIRPPSHPREYLLSLGVASGCFRSDCPGDPPNHRAVHWREGDGWIQSTSWDSNRRA